MSHGVADTAVPKMSASLHQCLVKASEQRCGARLACRGAAARVAPLRRAGARPARRAWAQVRLQALPVAAAAPRRSAGRILRQTPRRRARRGRRPGPPEPRAAQASVRALPRTKQRRQTRRSHLRMNDGAGALQACDAAGRKLRAQQHLRASTRESGAVTHASLRSLRARTSPARAYSQTMSVAASPPRAPQRAMYVVQASVPSSPPGSLRLGTSYRASTSSAASVTAGGATTGSVSADGSRRMRSRSTARASPHASASCVAKGAHEAATRDADARHARHTRGSSRAACAALSPVARSTRSSSSGGSDSSEAIRRHPRCAARLRSVVRRTRLLAAERVYSRERRGVRRSDGRIEDDDETTA